MLLYEHFGSGIVLSVTYLYRRACPSWILIEGEVNNYEEVGYRPVSLRYLLDADMLKA